MIVVCKTVADKTVVCKTLLKEARYAKNMDRTGTPLAQ